VITAWRITAAEYAESAFEGRGGLRRGARWHFAGTRIVYTAESVALATLEILANLPRPLQLPDFVVIPCYFHEALVEELDPGVLPERWYETPAPRALQNLGTKWVQARRTPVLKVPSALTQTDFNYLLNPEHDDFRSIDIGNPRPFQLDYRLVI
jgi:RES domain-containing protein